MPHYILINEKSIGQKHKEYSETTFPDIPYRSILKFSKITLEPMCQVNLELIKTTLIIPLVGGLEIDKENILVPGEYWELNQPSARLKNATKDKSCTFLKVELNKPIGKKGSKIYPFTLNNPASFPYFGLYAYKQEEKLNFKDASDILIYAVSGNFEIENRYINQGDALILENVIEMELECLTEQGLFVLFKA